MLSSCKARVEFFITAFMNTPTLLSTFLLTLLLGVGLLFFIRAAIKDRTQVVTLVSEQPETSLLSQLQQYLTNRAYRVTKVDADAQQMTFEGVVRPSWFMAIFLTSLAAVGILCLALVLAILLPTFAQLFFGLLILSPIAGVFYWRGAKRTEIVSLKLEPKVTARDANVRNDSVQSMVTVTAHRDELAELRRTLPLRSVE